MKIVAKNRKASGDYEIFEKFIAGIILTGAEVKSVKSGSCNLDGAYVFVNPTGAVVRNMNISLWEHANAISKRDYVADRDRALLLTKKELLRISTKRQQLKAQMVPLAIGIEKGYVKIEIALARALRKYETKNRRKEREEKLSAQRVAKTVETRY